jgi:hypothetical protein
MRRAALCVVLVALLAGTAADAHTTTVRGPWVLATLPALGTVTWRCDPKGQPRAAPGLGALGLGFRVFAWSATTDVRLRDASGTVTRLRLDPGHSVRFPFLPSHVQTLDFVQQTDAGKLVAHVRVDFVPHLLSTYCYPYLPPRVSVEVLPRR